MIPAAQANESKVESNYLKLHNKVENQLGEQVAGRNIVKEGYRKESGEVNPASVKQVREANQRARLALNPPVVEEVTYEPTTYETTEPVTPTYSGTSSGNATVQCESSGDYSANTGNGYYGGYQFDSSTWDAYGDSDYAEANEAPPAVQDAAAASVPYDAWPNCP